MVHKNKSLIVVQGINDKTYLVDAVKKSNFNLDMYDYKLIEPDTEGILDRHTSKFVRWLPLVDKFTDLKYLFSKSIKNECSKAIYKAVGEQKALGMSVDIIAHSLGTLMTLETPVEVDNVYFIGCPLSTLAFGGFVRKRTHIRMQCSRMFYVWSPVDVVCHNFNANVKKFLAKSYNVVPIVSNSGHGVANYLDDMQVVRELVENKSLDI